MKFQVTDMSEKVSPENLVPLLRELQFDDTFDEVWAFMRFDAKLEDKDVKTQLLVDLRHKQNLRQSKPRCFLTMSSIDQHLNLLTAATAMTVFQHHRKNLNISEKDLDRSIRSVQDLIRSDAVTLAQQLMVAVQKRQSELAYQST